jgi:hypothetical protein
MTVYGMYIPGYNNTNGTLKMRHYWAIMDLFYNRTDSHTSQITGMKLTRIQIMTIENEMYLKLCKQHF